MITDVAEDRLLITSDTHIGSYFCDARQKFIGFLEYARANKINVCLNGDGVDLLHTSLQKITLETAALLRELRRITSEITVYYTVGNHDIILEHYLGDWGGLQLVPYLNVTSGAKRLRVEHGHLYDAFLMEHPDLQMALTRFSGNLCRIYPPWYFWHEGYRKFRHWYLPRLLGRHPQTHNSPITIDQSPAYLEAAEELARRGFDFVIFGHTHRPGVLPLNDNRASYVNTGSWFKQPHYVVLDHGSVELKPWLGPPAPARGV
jgi:UDP-2,3-diacylglucosamine pyrophosphatase LpxH